MLQSFNYFEFEDLGYGLGFKPSNQFFVNVLGN